MTIPQQRLSSHGFWKQFHNNSLCLFVEFKRFFCGVNRMGLFSRSFSVIFLNGECPFKQSYSLLIFLLLGNHLGNLLGSLLDVRFAFLCHEHILSFILGPVYARPLEPFLSGEGEKWCNKLYCRLRVIPQLRSMEGLTCIGKSIGGLLR